MSYRIVDEKFWTDPKVRRQDIKTKVLFLYLLTSPHTHFCGLFYLPFPVIAFETGMDEKDIRKGMDTLSIGYQAKYDQENSIVWVVNMAKFACVNAKQWAGAINHIKTLQRTPLIAEFADHYFTPEMKQRYPIDTLSTPIETPIDTTDTDTDTDTDISRDRVSPDTLSDVSKKSKGRQPEESIPDCLKTEAFLKAWADWKAFRTEIKKKLTPTMIRQQFAKLESWGVDTAVEAINTSIANGWQGLFEPKGGAPKRQQPVDDDYDGPFLNRFEEESDRAGRWIVEQLEKDDELARQREEEAKRNANNAA